MHSLRDARRPRAVCSLVGLLALGASACRPAQADTDIFNSFPFTTRGIPLVPVAKIDPYSLSFATPFTVIGGTYTLNNINVPLAGLPGSRDAELQLRSTDASGLPGSVLETFTSSGVPTLSPGVVTFTDTNGQVLDAGNQYWVALLAPKSPEAFGWFDSASDTGPFAYSLTQGATWNQTPSFLTRRPALDVRGTLNAPAAVPEPGQTATFGLGLLGLAGLMLLARKRSARLAA